VAFLRFTRDKRGYEHFYLVEATPNRKGKLRSRLLYWFRTPPNVKVGREPFDENVRRLLEASNPGVVFDWRAILETPIPSAEAEQWRERRRAEKASRRRSEDDSRSGDADRSDDDRLSRPENERVEAADVEMFDEPLAAETSAAETVPVSTEDVAADMSPQVEPEASSTATPAGSETHRRKRRRRRGRKERRAAASPEGGAADRSARAEGSRAESPQALDDEPEDSDDEEKPSQQ
jgi:hypothetical protein